MHKDADSLLHNTTHHNVFVLNFKILRVVPEKSWIKKKFTHTQTNIVTEKTKTIYLLRLYTLYAEDIII